MMKVLVFKNKWQELAALTVGRALVRQNQKIVSPQLLA
jgi:hypothetical protein